MAADETGTIRPARFTELLGERYLSYALSTIMSRSLPDVRDGLKPVHRRLLHAMRELGLSPDAGFKKCARVVGDVMGKYHPHGDAAIYDAMVRLAQDFAVRYPLVEGQGNFGNIDGDNAAAMRYTEARLTEVAQLMLAGIDENAVDFRGTYDGEGSEPIVMPAAFPNLLANGSQGIAVGMATNIPPHNVAEVCDALLHLIKHPSASIEKLVDSIQGPDFPTGGTLAESREAVIAAYEKGRGAFRLRARWDIEELGRGTWQIVVHEIPYQVPKSRLVEKIAELMEAKKLPFLADILDESTTEVRLVLVPRSRSLDAGAVMETLFRQTDLETRFNLNMNVLDANSVPQVMSLRDVLQAFIEHRHDVLVRRSQFRLDRIDHRLEVLAGFLIAYLNLDEIIRIIREEDDPKGEMMRRWELTDVQAEAILNMRLRSLRRLEEVEIRKEFDGLTAEKADLEALLAQDGVAKRMAAIADEIRHVRTKFGPKTALGKRRTIIGDAPSGVEVPIEIAVEREPVTIICSERGWIRAVKGHLTPDAEMKYKEGDSERFRLHAHTTDKLLLLASNGRFYTLGADKLPSGRGTGEPVRLIIELGNNDEIVALMVHQATRKLLVASSDGRGFVVPEGSVVAQTRNGRQVLNPGIGAKAAFCVPVTGDSVAVIGDNRRLLVFPVSELPEMERGRGVILQSRKNGVVTDVMIFDLAEGIAWQAGDRQRRETDLTRWQGRRGQVGGLPPHGFPRNNRFA